jgi:UDP-glucose 4-epimerase
MHVMLTGGAGFIGSHIADKLIQRGDRVTIVDNLSTGKRRNIHPAAQFIQMDIRDPQMGVLFADDPPAAVIHQAAQISVSRSMVDPVEDARINVEGTLGLLELSRLHQVQRFLMASSAAVYGDPQQLPISEEHPLKPYSPYGISKMAAEHYLAAYTRHYGLSGCVLRYANVFGPRQIAKGEGGVVSIFCEKLIGGEPPIIEGDGKQTRDFIYVADVARANLAALDNQVTGIFNIGTQKETSINDLIRALEAACGSKITAIYGPPREGDIRFSVLDAEKARHALDWQAQVELDQGLIDTFRYYGQLAEEEEPHALRP